MSSVEQLFVTSMDSKDVLDLTKYNKRASSLSLVKQALSFVCDYVYNSRAECVIVDVSMYKVLIKSGTKFDCNIIVVDEKGQLSDDVVKGNRYYFNKNYLFTNSKLSKNEHPVYPLPENSVDFYDTLLQRINPSGVLYINTGLSCVNLNESTDVFTLVRIPAVLPDSRDVLDTLPVNCIYYPQPAIIDNGIIMESYNTSLEARDFSFSEEFGKNVRAYIKRYGFTEEQWKKEYARLLDAIRPEDEYEFDEEIGKLLRKRD